VDASRFDPPNASQADWEKMWQWRKLMDSAPPIAKKKESKPTAP
jgi:hypothetical protein